MTLLGVAAFGVFLASILRPRSGFELSFLGYTNDSLGFRQHWYQVMDTGPSSMAVFGITNRTKRQTLYSYGYAEVRTPAGWARDTNQIPFPNGPGFNLLKPGEGATLLVPTPPGTGVWRYTAKEFVPMVSRYRWKVADAAKRVGIHIGDRTNDITSVEIWR